MMESIQTLLQSEFWEESLLPWAWRVLVALLIWFIGKWVAKRISIFSKRLMERSRVDITLRHFFGNIIYIVLLAVVGIAAIDHLGIQTTSVLAIFGAAGLAVGLAMKDSLSNVASGVMLIIFRPFRVDDFIEAAGTAGVVEAIGIFATQMRTGDNRAIIVPNSQIYQSQIINYSAKPTRRIDLVFGIGYSDDLKLAKSLIEQAIQADERILIEPAPSIALGELGESSVDINVRPWVSSADYWPVRADLLENVKQAFDANGISIPFPQRDLHVYEMKQ